MQTEGREDGVRDAGALLRQTETRLASALTVGGSLSSTFRNSSSSSPEADALELLDAMLCFQTSGDGLTCDRRPTHIMYD